jgi:inorganic triphosphatase YgiF
MTKKEMNLALTHSSYSHLNSFIRVLNEFIISFQSKNHSVSRFYEEFKFCADIRRKRKAFKKVVHSLLTDFSKQDESLQVEIELYFYNSLKKLDQLSLIAKQELDKSSFKVFNTFLSRELKKTVSMFSEAQGTMSQALYKDNTDKILGDPKLHNELLDAWGDLANDDY